MSHHNVDFHMYADDTQLYLTFESSSADVAIGNCVTVNIVKMKRDKTELVQWLVVLSAGHHPDEVISKSSVPRNRQ